MNRDFVDIFGLLWRMVKIFFRTQSTRLSGPPRYLQRCRRAYRKFSRTTWKKGCTSKHEILSEYCIWLWASFFKISTLFSFFWHIIRLVRRMATIFLLKQRRRLDRPPRYLQCCYTDYRKPSTDIYEKFAAKNMRFCQNI